MTACSQLSVAGLSDVEASAQSFSEVQKRLAYGKETDLCNENMCLEFIQSCDTITNIWLPAPKHSDNIV